MLGESIERFHIAGMTLIATGMALFYFN